MLRIVFFVCSLLFALNVFAQTRDVDIKDEINSFIREVNRFEKELPFFTKSKITVFFKCGSKDYKDVFYGLYINDNLVKTGTITDIHISDKELFIGDFPVNAGVTTVKIRLNKDGYDIQKKFQVEIPEYRRIALQLFFTDSYQKPRVITQAWVVE